VVLLSSVVATVSAPISAAMMRSVTTLRRTPLATAVGQAVVAVLVAAYALAFVTQPLIPRVFSVANVVDSVAAISGISAVLALTLAGVVSLAIGRPRRLAFAAWGVAGMWLVTYFARSPIGTADARWLAVALAPLLPVATLELVVAVLV
jgi:predicted aspartyl protease